MFMRREELIACYFQVYHTSKSCVLYTPAGRQEVYDSCISKDGIGLELSTITLVQEDVHQAESECLDPTFPLSCIGFIYSSLHRPALHWS